MKRSLFALALFTFGCGGALPSADESPEHLTENPTEHLTGNLEGAPLSCTLPDRPVTHGPSTSAPFALVQLSTATYPKALCNDGTAATYMIRRNPQSTKWLIWLEGGGYCVDATTCAQRWKNAGATLMSSTSDVQRYAKGTLTFPSRGVFSVDLAENPTFHDANLVQIPYCSSDLWSGDRLGDASKPTTDVKRWHFRGRAILQGVLRELALRENLSAATDIVYAGGSAGAAGVYLTVDDASALVPSGARFLGLPDAGFRFDHPSYDPATGRESTAVPTAQRFSFELATSTWGGRGDTSCDSAAATADERVSCRDTAWLTTQGHVRTPMLLLNNQYDQNALGNLGIEFIDGMARNDAERGYVQRYAARSRELLAATDSIHSIFSDYNYNHVTAPSVATGSLTVQGVSERDAIDAFYRRPCTPRRLIEAPIAGVP